MAKFSLVAQIAEVNYEIKMRKYVYPTEVARGRMKHAESQMHLELMASVLSTLEFMQANEQTIREAIKAKRLDDTVARDEAVCAECGRPRDDDMHREDGHDFRARV